MRALLTTALVLIAGLAIGSAVCADLPYRADVVATKGTSENTWIYTVTNTSTAPQYVLWVFNILVDEQTDVLSAAALPGWTANTDTEHFITWMYQSGVLGVGETRTGFEACYSGTPTFQSFTAQFDNVETSESLSADGVVRTPEPTGAAVLMTGLAPIAAFALRRRRQD